METKRAIQMLIETGVKSVVGLLPNPASVIFNSVYDSVKDSVLNKRAEKWKSEVISRLEKLESDYEKLINDDNFASALIRTSELAIKTKSDEKRKLLANALINSHKYEIEEDKVATFLNLVDKYTVLHIQIIKYLHDEYMEQSFYNNISPTFFVLFKMKFNKTEDVYLMKAIKDLQNDCLVEDFKYDLSVSYGHKRYELLTKLGKDFYVFLIRDYGEIDEKN